mgnify:CR=1 FL=1
MDSHNSTFEENSVAPAWTTLAADCAAEAATSDNLPNPCLNHDHIFISYMPHRLIGINNLEETLL